MSKNQKTYTVEETLGWVTFFIITGYLILKLFDRTQIQWGIVHYGCTVSILCFISGSSKYSESTSIFDGPHMHMPPSKGTYLAWVRTEIDHYEYQLVSFDPDSSDSWSDVIQWWEVPVTHLTCNQNDV